MKILAVSGSLKADSTNAALLRAAAKLAPAGTGFEFYDRQIGELPHFRPDLDEEGMSPPETVRRWRLAVAAADALLVSCPEYAHGVPGSFKNALDWLVSTNLLAGKPLALLAASPSGAPYARTALVPTLLVMGARLVFDDSLVLARKHFTGDGGIGDTELEAQVRQALGELAAACRPG